MYGAEHKAGISVNGPQRVSQFVATTVAAAKLTTAGIPRRRHGHGHRHQTRPTHAISSRGSSRGNSVWCFGRKIVAVFGESVSVSVSVSASWNASLYALTFTHMPHILTV